VEVVRRALAVWNADNLDAFLAELDPELEWHPSIEPALEGRETIYRGGAMIVREGPGTNIAARRGEASRVKLRRLATSATRSWSGVIST
jgi:hypothetical protein